MYLSRKDSRVEACARGSMLAKPARFAWLTSGLYWRTFFLLSFLIAASMAAVAADLRSVTLPSFGHESGGSKLS